VTTAEGEKLYQFRHQVPAWRTFREFEHHIGKEGHDVKAVRLIRDDGIGMQWVPEKRLG